MNQQVTWMKRIN